MTRPFTFFVSDVEVVVEGLPAAVRAGLEACFGSCGRAPLPVAARARFLVEERGGEFWISRDGEPCGGSGTLTTLLPRVEGALYAAFPGWHAPPRVILHAAGVVVDERVLVLAGPSGAGKTSLARALLARGVQYLSDELVITDGARVWGVPRALQFDLLPPGASPPPWLGAVDLSSYRFQNDAGTSTRPLLAPPPAQVSANAHDAARARVVLLERGATTAVGSASPLDALRELHEGAFSEVGADLGALVSAPLGVRWDEPGRAVDALLRALG